MVVDFSHRRSRWSFLFLIILAAGEFSFLAAKVWVAEQWNESSDPKKWLAAAQLEPATASAGRVRMPRGHLRWESAWSRPICSALRFG